MCIRDSFFIAINIESFTELEEFKKTTGDILRELRASRKAPGAERIYTAGEKEYLAFLEGSRTGVAVGESLEKDLAFIAREYGLEI